MIVALAIGLSVLAMTHTSATVSAEDYPPVVQLPRGWLPEGIDAGQGTTIYSGSRRHGAIYAADVSTGEGTVVVPPQMNRIAVGLKYDERTNLIWVAGGGDGAAYVYDASTGQTVRAWSIASAPTFINDVIVTRDAAYFTDSMKPVLYKVQLGNGGALLASSAPVSLPLGGAYTHQPGFNLNGIEASADGSSLIVVQSGTGRLFKVDAITGVASLVNLGGYSVSAGDGMLLDGRTLYVVRNNLNTIAEIALSADLLSGALVREMTNTGQPGSSAFETPTTIAKSGDDLYVVNARFAAGAGPDLEYRIVRVER